MSRLVRWLCSFISSKAVKSDYPYKRPEGTEDNFVPILIGIDFLKSFLVFEKEAVGFIWILNFYTWPFFACDT